MKLASMKIRIDFQEDLLGSWPADQEVLTRYISNKAPADWLQAEEGDAIAKRSEDTGYTVFPQDQEGMYLWNYHLKGFLKEAGNVLKEAVGVKNLRSKIDNHVFVNPRRLYIFRGTNGKVQKVKEPDDILERPLRAQTAMGPRVTLAGSERIMAPSYIYATVELVPHKELDLDLIQQLLDYGRLKGLGQWRNASYGSFTWIEAKE